MVSLFKKDIQYLKGIGPKSAVLFRKIGAPSIGALLHIYPRMYEDWSNIFSVEEAISKEKVCLKLKIVSEVKTFNVKKGNKVCKVMATDGLVRIDIVFFNNVYTAKNLKINNYFLVFGKVVLNGGNYEIVNPEIKSIDSKVKMRPVYTQTKGISSWRIESAVRNALELIKSDLNDTIPKSILDKYELCPLEFALENIHFPKDKNSLEKAKKRLAFEELYFWQMGISLVKNENGKNTKIKISKDFSEEFYFMLPFEPTNAQKRVIRECNDDMMKSSLAMNRLLQGDVGSGKTVVAAALIYNVIKNGYQAAFMVPTEVLALQHYNTVTKLFDGLNIKVNVLTGNTKLKEKRKIIESISQGEVQLVIGTHSLISDNLQFGKLGLVITDEQHRFGVRQRTKLVDKGANPHILVMSATPIPRTLALVIYGDLDISVLDELPPGRQYIDTFCVNTSKKDRVYNFIKKHLDKNLQGYIVCPAIEEGETGLVAIQTYAKNLDSGVFKDYSVGILHGKMKSSEKEEVMRKFKNGEYKLLISTTVIEVGIDVPNAVIMVIENAERFGLSQMHQMRGRVGRGKEKSYCILISDSKSEDSVKRFKAMISTNDGFRLASEDLSIRGPGEFLGNRQHGMPEMKISNMLTDINLLKESEKAVKEFISTDNDLLSKEIENIKFYICNFLGIQLNYSISIFA